MFNATKVNLAMLSVSKKITTNVKKLNERKVISSKILKCKLICFLSKR
jgi:hypothetical protein